VTIEQEIQDAVKKLQKCGKLFYDNRQRVAALGGAYASSAAEAAAPKSSKPHKRYSTAKLTKKIRAPKGLGKVVATYFPGNLGRSINVLKFSRGKVKGFCRRKTGKTGDGQFSGAQNGRVLYAHG
jgi:hypothetical protein